MLFYAYISVNIARKIKCYILKSNLILGQYNAFYFTQIAFTNFTLHEIKQCIVFLGHPLCCSKTSYFEPLRDVESDFKLVQFF